MMLWAKKVGPMTGIFDSTGISIGAKVPPAFQVD